MYKDDAITSRFVKDFATRIVKIDGNMWNVTWDVTRKDFVKILARECDNKDVDFWALGGQVIMCKELLFEVYEVYYSDKSIVNGKPHCLYKIIARKLCAE